MDAQTYPKNGKDIHHGWDYADVWTDKASQLRHEVQKGGRGELVLKDPGS